MTIHPNPFISIYGEGHPMKNPMQIAWGGSQLERDNKKDI